MTRAAIVTLVPAVAVMARGSAAAWAVGWVVMHLNPVVILSHLVDLDRLVGI